MIFDVGDRIVLTGRFFANADTTPVPANPTTVTCQARRPDGTTVSPAVTNAGPGVFEALLDVDQEGTWRFVFTGAGVVVATEEGLFNVRSGSF